MPDAWGSEVALAAVAGGMLLMRSGWGRAHGRRRALAGWCVMLAAALTLTLAHGAWGLAMAFLAAMLSALLVVLHAGWTSPVRTKRVPREPQSVSLPRRWPDIGRRFAVFVLVVPCAFAAAQWLTFGVQALGRRGGMGAADGIALTLFLQPVLWTAIMAIQMTRTNALRMIAPPAAAAALGALLWGLS